MASLAEAATIELFKEINPTPSRENVTLAIKGGVAKVVREWLEQQLGRTIISDSNSSTLRISGESPDEQYRCISHILEKDMKVHEI